MIAICGGIGSGKSVVSAILRSMGYEVYDCDCEARHLMEGSEDIKARIASEISFEVIAADGGILRPRLAELVFADPELLLRLNAIVHGAVRADIARRLAANPQLFVETAIPVSGGIAAMEQCSCVWQVTAPEALRVERVMKRNHITATEVIARIGAQHGEYVPAAMEIVNDGRQAVLPQLHRLLQTCGLR